MCSTMNRGSPAQVGHRVSPRPVVCPLVRLGRVSPPGLTVPEHPEYETRILETAPPSSPYCQARRSPSSPYSYRHVPSEEIPDPEDECGNYPCSQTSRQHRHPRQQYFVMSEQFPGQNSVGNAKIKQCNLVYGHRSDYKTCHSVNIGLSSLAISDDNFWSGRPEGVEDQEFYYGRQTRSYKYDGFPNPDQGYHTLVNTQTGQTVPQNLIRKHSAFDRLNDELIVKIFSYLYSAELATISKTCRRFEQLAWKPQLWKTITLDSGGDRSFRVLLRQLCQQAVCSHVERIYLSDSARMSDRELTFLARRCPHLTHLQMHGCTSVTDPAVGELVARCANLQHLDMTGCTNVSGIGIPADGLHSGNQVGGPLPTPAVTRLALQYLDLTDCPAVGDDSLRIIVMSCPQLAYLYLRRCVQITDAGLKYVPSFCAGLREFSVSDCSRVTDFGLYELAKLGATLRYLSVAKCDRVSDAGLKVIARRCYKLRYLNARGCEAVSDDAITVLARSCTRLRALDIGKCDVSDAGLRALAESCPNIKKLSLRNCDLVTDRGIQCVAYYCRGLQQLNIQDCQISIEGYRAVKQYCRRCVIEHTNPGFF